MSKGILLTKCNVCSKPGYKLNLDPEDKTSPFYYKHFNEPYIKGKVKTCKNGKTKWEPAFPE